MTTKITVDAHAGWPVRVEAKDTYGDDSQIRPIDIVQPGEIKEFYVFDTRQLIITEMKR